MILYVQCPTCRGALKIWLGGADYLECPDCDGVGRVDATRVITVRGITFVRDFAPRDTSRSDLLVPFHRSQKRAS